MDNYSVIKEYLGHVYSISLIKKIKIREKKEYIISYDSKNIKIWK